MALVLATAAALAAAWKDTTDGIHAFLTFDSKVDPSLAAAYADRIDYVWGSTESGTNVTLDLRWRLASGSGRLLEWSEAQRQVEAASGKVLQSHNESHAFRRYSPTPDAAAFGPPAGVACE